MHTSPKPFAFVLMPFADSFNDVYEVAIRPACESAGAYAERVDKQIFAGSILDRVYNQIAKADLIVADMSERNPNVFYEVGYAHALGKTTILLTRDEADIPFDLRQYPHIIYRDSLAKLKGELERRVRWHVENPSKVEATPSEIVIRVNETFLGERPAITTRTRECPGSSLNSLPLSIAFQNKAERNVRTISFRIGLFSSPVLTIATDKDGTKYTSILVEDRRLFTCPFSVSLLPEQWDVVDFVLWNETDRVRPGDSFDCCIRLYFDSGCTDYPFVITVESPTSKPANHSIERTA